MGHRGAAGLQLENTIASILEALKYEVDFIEIDVWNTADNEIIVFHDAYLDRLTTEGGFIHEMNYEVIKSIKLNNGDRIPTLQEVIQIIREHKVKLFVEVKSENAFSKTLEILTRNLSYSQFIIGSFFHKGIMDLKKINPMIQTSVIFECVPVSLEKYLEMIDPDYVTVSIETHNQYLIDTVKSQNRNLVFYTVNTDSDIILASKAIPFAVITDFPNIFAKSI